MEKSAFFQNLIHHSKEDGFSLFVSDDKDFDPSKPSASVQVKQVLALAATSIAISAVLGVNTRLVFGRINASQMSPSAKETLIRDLQGLQSYCDLIGIKLSNGPVHFRLAIDSDEISDESLIGRFTVIHGQLLNFIKYAAPVFNNVRHGVYAEVVTVFSSHKRAKLFNDQYAKKCTHHTFFKKTFTSPWIVDLENEEVKQYRKHFDLLGKGESKGAELFKK